MASIRNWSRIRNVCTGILLTGLSGSVLRLYHYRGCLLILLGILIEFNFKSVGRERLAKTGTIENIEGIMVYEGHAINPALIRVPENNINILLL